MKNLEELEKTLESHNNYLEEVENELRMTNKINNISIIDLLCTKLSDGKLLIDVIKQTKEQVKILEQSTQALRLLRN